MSLRLKTILGVALIEVTLLVILVWNGMELMRRSGEDQLIQRAETTSQLFASMVKDGVLSYDLATLETFLAELLKNQGLIYARVYDQDQLLVSGGDATLLQRQFQQDQSLDSATDGVFDIRSNITESGQLYGWVELGLSTQQLEERLSDATLKTSGLAVTEIILSALFSFLLGSWLVMQLEVLRKASSEIASGKLGIQIPVSGKDEIAETAHHFNQMSSVLQESTDKLNLLNASLEDQVVERTEQLEYANESLHSILQSMSEILLVIDQNGMTQITNPASSRLLGYGEALLLNQSIYDLVSGDEERARLTQLIEEEIQTGEEFSLRTASGELLPVLMMASRIQNSNQEESFTVITAQDLRELKRAEEGERYLSFQEGLNEMSANVLHNIGNNLTGIRGGLLKIEQQSGNLKKISAMLERFSSEVLQEVELIRQTENAPAVGPALNKVPLVLEKSGKSIENIARSEVDVALREIDELTEHIQSVIRATPLTERSRQSSKEFELNNLLQDVETILSQEITRAGVTIKHDLSPRLGSLSLSRNLLLQALVHLTRNSLEAVDEDVEGEITIAADQWLDEENQFWLTIDIVDNGCGIDENILDQVSKSGFTTKKGGSGNGLHAVGNYVNSIRGEIQVKNRADQSGVAVTLSLPLKS